MWASLGHYSAAHKPQACTSFAVKSAEGTSGASQEGAASLSPSCPPSQMGNGGDLGQVPVWVPPWAWLPWARGHSPPGPHGARGSLRTGQLIEGRDGAEGLRVRRESEQCVSVCAWVCVHLWMCVCLCVRMCECGCMCVDIGVWLYVDTCGRVCECVYRWVCILCGYGCV